MSIKFLKFISSKHRAKYDKMMHHNEELYKQIEDLDKSDDPGKAAKIQSLNQEIILPMLRMRLMCLRASRTIKAIGLLLSSKNSSLRNLTLTLRMTDLGSLFQQSLTLGSLNKLQSWKSIPKPVKC